MNKITFRSGLIACWPSKETLQNTAIKKMRITELVHTKIAIAHH